MIIVGIDLSGPRNVVDTCLVSFKQEQGGEGLRFLDARNGADDDQILEMISRFEKSESIIVGLDAPLSYLPRGGLRESDKGLRKHIEDKGGDKRVVMPPTMARMVYLTLRGIVLARMLETLKPNFASLKIIEVHPGACLLLHGAPSMDVATFKHNKPARKHLLEWLGEQKMTGIPRRVDITDHYVAACSAAFGAWCWATARTAWCFPARPPQHPYEFAC